MLVPALHIAPQRFHPRPHLLGGVNRLHRPQIQRRRRAHIGTYRQDEPRVGRIIQRRWPHRIQPPVGNLPQIGGIIHQPRQIRRPHKSRQLHRIPVPLPILPLLPRIAVERLHPRPHRTGGGRRIADRQVQLPRGRIGGKPARQMQTNPDQRRRHPILQVPLRRRHILNIRANLRNPPLNVNYILHRRRILQQHNQPLLLRPPRRHPRLVVHQLLRNILRCHPLVRNDAQTPQHRHRLVKPLRRNADADGSRAIPAFPHNIR